MNLKIVGQTLGAVAFLFSGSAFAAPQFETNVTLALVKCTTQQNSDGSQSSVCTAGGQNVKSDDAAINLNQCQQVYGQQVCLGSWKDSLTVNGSTIEAVVVVGQGQSGATTLDFKLSGQPNMVSLQLAQNHINDSATMIGQSYADPSDPNSTLTPFISISSSSKASEYSLRRAFQLK